MAYALLVRSESQQVPYGSGDASSGGAMRRPEVRMVRYGRVLRVESLRRGIQQAKALAGHARDDLGGYAAPGPRFAHTKQAARSSHRSHHGVSVQGLD